MTQFICWIIFPLVLALLSLGCGLLLERATGATTKSSATARFTTPFGWVRFAAGSARPGESRFTIISPQRGYQMTVTSYGPSA